VSALEQLPHSNKSSTQWYRHSSSHSSVRRRTRLKDARYTYKDWLEACIISWRQATDLCPTARWTNLPLCSNNKSQNLLWLQFAAAAAVPTSNSTWED
jgi:hypothetical protein